MRGDYERICKQGGRLGAGPNEYDVNRSTAIAGNSPLKLDLRHDPTAATIDTVKINRNFHNLGVKLGTSLSRSNGEEVEEEIHLAVES